jgi:UDP-N-acetylmuramate dehydrogenase
MLERTMKAWLTDYTTYRLGGPCRELVAVQDVESAAEIIREWNAQEIPWRVMGGGSNVLVADAGIRKRCCGSRRSGRIAAWGATICATAATARSNALARFAAEEGRSGLAFGTGIPGTVAAASAQRGGFRRQLGDVLERVEVLTRAGAKKIVPRAELDFAYRASSLQRTGDVVLRAWFRVAADDRERLLAETGGILAARRAKHPDWREEPTAGSFFKNLPAETDGGRRRSAEST